MKILFLHPNFPAQFKQLAPNFANEGHDVKFLCQTHYGRTLPKVDIITIKGGGSHEAIMNSSNNATSRMLMRAKAYRQGFVKLKSLNWNPDLVVAHSGWGCGVYVKEQWPKCVFLAYSEWWFKHSSVLIERYKKNSNFIWEKHTEKCQWERNLTMATELSSANEIIAPTLWQKQQLPPCFQSHCTVIHEGIDDNVFQPNYQVNDKSPKLTYGTRGMEPIRCFPEFVEASILILKKWPHLTIEIAGNDEICYGGRRPPEGTWGQWAKKKFEKNNLANRVKWMGRMDLSRYTEWLQSSWCHVYLTEPFVLSWSYLEALACGIPIVASDTNPLKEFKYISENVWFVNHTDGGIESIADGVASALRYVGNLDRPSSRLKTRKTPSSSDAFRSWRLIADRHLDTLA